MKAEVEPLHVIVGAALLLMVFVVSVLVYTQFFGKEVSTTKCIIHDLGADCDNDGKNNLFDACPCDPKNQDNCEQSNNKESCMNLEKCLCDNEKETRE